MYLLQTGTGQKLSSREDDGKQWAAVPLCKVTKYELMTNLADIKVSLSLHKRTIVMWTGKKGFHKISSANQQAGNDGRACGWADALPAETNPDIMLLPVSERSYKKTTSMSLAEIWHQKYSRSNPKLYIIWEWRSLPFSQFELEHPWQTNDALLDREIALLMASNLLTVSGTACVWLPLLTIQF